MKTTTSLMILLGLSVTVVVAQVAPTSPNPVPPQESKPVPQQEVDVSKDLPEVSLERAERFIYFQTNMLSRVFGLNVRYTGVVPQVRKVDKPLQLLNPFAPSRYGNAMDKVVVDPSTGRAEGILFWGVRY